MIVTAGALSATFLPGLGMTGVSLRCRGREHLALPGGLPRAAGRRHAGPPAAGPVGEPAGVAPVPGRRRRRRPDRPPARHRHQRPPDPRSARGQAGMAARSLLGRRRPGRLPGLDRRRRARRSRIRTASRSPSSPANSRSRSTRRSSRPAAGGSRWRSGGTPTCGCRARPAASGTCGCPLARISLLDERGLPTGATQAERTGERTDRPAHVRRPVPPRPPAPARTGGRGRVVDHDPLWTRVPVRAGVGAGRPAVRRARADDSRHEQPGRRHRAARRTGRLVHCPVLDLEPLEEAPMSTSPLSRHRRRWLRRRRLRQGAGASTACR